jgi:DnaJ-class molecular chaperone
MAPRDRFDKDYYRIMEVTPGATEDELRRAYRRLALQWHPDRNPGRPQAAERFKEISEAYAVLIDAGKRRQYDAARGTGSPGDFHHTQEDIFRDLFADPRASAIFEDLAREFARHGLRVDRHTFHQTLFGGRTVVRGGVIVITPFTPALALFRLARAALRGSPPAVPERSRPSGVLGALVRAGRWLLGRPAAHAPHTDAMASRDVTVPLRLSATEAARGGRKRVLLEHDDGRDEVLVTIPPGVRHGTRLRLRGKGRAGARGGRGDLFLAVEVGETA